MKYLTTDEAEKAIRALNNQYTFPGVSSLDCIMDYKMLLAAVR